MLRIRARGLQRDHEYVYEAHIGVTEHSLLSAYVLDPGWKGGCGRDGRGPNPHAGAECVDADMDHGRPDARTRRQLRNVSARQDSEVRSLGESRRSCATG